MTDQQLAKIEKSVAVYAAELKAHTEHDALNFRIIKESLEDIDNKLDDLRISVAKRNGALDEARRHSRTQGATWGAVVASIISVVGIVLGSWLGVS